MTFQQKSCRMEVGKEATRSIPRPGWPTSHYCTCVFRFISSKMNVEYYSLERLLNPLPHMPILGSSNSAANEDMMAKIWTNGGGYYLIE